LGLAHRYITALKLERQQLGVPVLKERLLRREELAAEAADVEREIASLADAVPLAQAEEQLARQNAERQEPERLTVELQSVFGASQTRRYQSGTA